MVNEQTLLDLAVLLKELYSLTKRYGAATCNFRQVENILAIIYEEGNPKQYSELYHCLKGLYFAKAGLSEFYVSPTQSDDWRAINQRLSEIKNETAYYEQLFEKYH
ncbi:hypothetical protein [Enterococcus sp. BWR-S5]|uniref:hypothetical protein n=1 Tax=Enterococcus sp. BWR-S5 TaxID=2787714 RepID=UPI001923390E|nr:hypothetical protein [Enterococcus sp. BWR-S5]MBL1227397.1 hypothetical protein [Enterococcus sp. BWR-S5]